MSSSTSHTNHRTASAETTDITAEVRSALRQCRRYRKRLRASRNAEDAMLALLGVDASLRMLFVATLFMMKNLYTNRRPRMAVNWLSLTEPANGVGRQTMSIIRAGCRRKNLYRAFGLLEAVVRTTGNAYRQVGQLRHYLRGNPSKLGPAYAFARQLDRMLGRVSVALRKVPREQRLMTKTSSRRTLDKAVETSWPVPVPASPRKRGRRTSTGRPTRPKAS